MKRLRVPLLAALLLGGLHDAASADVYWSSIANGCTPDALSIQNDRYQTKVDSYVAPKNGNVDPIVLICGVMPNVGATEPNQLVLTFLDSTATSAAASVTAQLVRIKRSNGARSVVATVTSDSSSATAVTSANGSITGGALNFDIYYYFVRIDMGRSASTQNLRAIGVALDVGS